MKNDKLLRLSIYLVFFTLIVALPQIFSDDYSLHLMIMSCIFILLAMSFNLAWGYTGLTVLCLPTFLSLGAYTSGILVLKAGIPFLLAAMAALIVSAISGLSIGYLTLRFKGPYFVIVTLVFNFIMRLIFNNSVKITGGPYGMPGIPHPEIIILNFVKIYISSNRDFCYFTFGLVSLLMVFFYYLVNSRIGRVLSSIRENELLAEFMGVNTLKYKLLALLLCSFFSGFAGILHAHYLTVVVPDLFDSYYMVSPMAMTMLGGRGTFFGPIFTAVFLTILPEYLRFSKIFREFFFGSFIIILVIFKPEGIDFKSILSRIYSIVRWKRAWMSFKLKT